MAKSSAMSLLSQNVKRLLDTYGWKQKDLAEAIGVLPTNLSKTLNGKHSPSLDLIESIADSLGVEVRELFAPAPAPAPELTDKAAS